MKRKQWYVRPKRQLEVAFPGRTVEHTWPDQLRIPNEDKTTFLQLDFYRRSQLYRMVIYDEGRVVTQFDGHNINKMLKLAMVAGVMAS